MLLAAYSLREFTLTTSLFLQVFFLVDFLYFFSVQGVTGYTLGGAVFGIIVAKKGGGKADPLKLFVRWFMFWASIFMFGLAQVTVFFNPERKTLYDLVSGTEILRKRLNL
jgi:uncharacterized RDD family membrane protein YckC